jgi:hypothetical protein
VPRQTGVAAARTQLLAEHGDRSLAGLVHEAHGPALRGRVGHCPDDDALLGQLGPGASPQLVAPDRREQRRRAGERTITVLGEKLRPSGGDSRLPWHELVGVDGVYFVSGDEEALRQARAARVLVATARELSTLRTAGVPLDVVIGSGDDEGEVFRPGDLEPPPELVVTTSGSLGGWAQPGGPFRPAPVPGPVVDAYGCGDAFAAGLTFALARGDTSDQAIAFAARCGAAVLTGRGPYTSQLAGDAL